jgi:type I restriction enzyme, S subunit
VRTQNGERTILSAEENRAGLESPASCLEGDFGEVRGISEWTQKPLGRLCSIKTGKKDVNEGSPNGAYPFFTCSRDVHASDSYSFDTDAILIAGNGAVGDTKLYRGKFEAYQRTYVLDGFEEDLDFIFYVLKGSLSEALSKVVSGSTMPYIRKGDLERFPIPLPPLPEQKKIAYILSTVQRAIEAQERIIQITTELKKALMHKLFTEGLRGEPQKETEIGLVPESWEVVRIKTTGTVVTGSTPSTKNANFYGGDYNLISPADLDNGKYVRSAHKTLTKAGFEKCRTLPRDSVLVGCIGNVGKLGMVADNCSTTNQQINSIIPNSEFSPHFLYYALQLCRPRLEQAAAKVTLPILNKSNFENFQIAAPEHREQEEIAGYLGILDQKLENACRKAAQLQHLFRTLLHELMTAKTRVHEIELGKECAA